MAAGTQIESGNLKEASYILSDQGWIKDLQRSSKIVSRKADITKVVDAINATKEAVNKEDSAAARTAFVGMSAEVQSWAKASGMAQYLKGL